MKQIDRAQLIARVVSMAEQLQQILDILMPEESETVIECSHPIDQIEHEETMDDEQHPWRCRACGKEQYLPFHSEV